MGKSSQREQSEIKRDVGTNVEKKLKRKRMGMTSGKRIRKCTMMY